MRHEKSIQELLCRNCGFTKNKTIHEFKSDEEITKKDHCPKCDTELTLIGAETFVYEDLDIEIL